jgi:hypothetical protein
MRKTHMVVAASIITGAIAAAIGLIDSHYVTEWRSELPREIAITVAESRGGKPVDGVLVIIEKTAVVKSFRAMGSEVWAEYLNSRISCGRTDRTGLTRISAWIEARGTENPFSGVHASFHLKDRLVILLHDEREYLIAASRCTDKHWDHLNTTLELVVALDESTTTPKQAEMATPKTLSD